MLKTNVDKGFSVMSVNVERVFNLFLKS